MRRFSALFALVFVLSACSTLVDRSTQDIWIDTPGVAGALCFVERPGYRVRVWAPQTIHITKSKGPMEVHCIAPGNREKTVIVESERPKSFYWNLINPPGAVVDYNTGAMYKYPEIISVDFRGMKPKPMPLPDYQYLLKDNPYLVNMEEFRAGKSALQSDRYKVIPTLQPRVTDQSLYGGGGIIGNSSSDEARGSGEVGDSASESSSSESFSSGQAGGAAEALTRKMNPGVFGDGGSVLPLSTPAPPGDARGAPVGISPSQ